MAENRNVANTYAVRWIVLAGIAFLVTAGVIWYKNIYLNPTKVFWSTIENNLSTNSITRQVSSANEEQTVNQFIRVQAGSQKISEALEVITQTGSEVARQTIGTKDTDYSRYLKINTDKKDANGQPVDYASIQGVWGKADADESGSTPAQAFNRAVLGTIPTANLTHDQRDKLIKTIKDSGVFTIDFSKVTKQTNNGDINYIYELQIHPEPYFAMMREFIGMLGLDTSVVPAPENYKGASPIDIKVSLKPIARQIVKITYLTNGQEEIYDGYGLNSPITIPDQTIPLNELQERILKTR